jgi:hypothetical protein
VFCISAWLATTYRTVYKVSGSVGGRLLGTPAGKRKNGYIPTDRDVIILAGKPAVWADTDGGCFTGNARINLAGESAEAVREILERDAVHEIPSHVKQKILFWGPLDQITEHTNPQPLYPEVSDECAA